jgi:GTP cyclohydrolase II
MSDIGSPLVSSSLPTKWGEFNISAHINDDDEHNPHLALVHKDFNAHVPTYVRIHSECLTGDLFGSLRCDCGEQLDNAMQIIDDHHGILIYLRQEGRGIGLVNKLKAYNLQDQGLSTIEANTHLGFLPDARKYDIAIRILEHLGIKEVVLITNNPDKINAFKHSQVQVIDRMPIIIPEHKENSNYLKVKKEKMGHLL